MHGIKLINRLRLFYSHLNEHKFRFSFRANIDPIFNCSLETETTLHYLLRCTLYCDLRIKIFNDIWALSLTLDNLPHEKLLNTLL